VKVADYQCVKLGELWHLTQEQAVPPPITRMAAYTSCAKWAEFKLGYERRRPTCPECMSHVAVYEKKKRGSAFDWMDQIGEPPPEDEP
jgi:hypothetical protein